MSISLPATAAELTPVPRHDFPTWLPAMLVKELRQGLRARGFVGTFVVFQLILILMFLWAFRYFDAQRSGSFYPLNNFFWSFVSAFLVLVTPLRGLGALRDEIDAKSIDLLVLTRLKSWQIVLGKWSSLMAQSLLLVVSLLPYCVVRYFFGAVNLVEDFGVLAAMFVASAVITAVSLWFSGMPKALRSLLPILMVLGFQGTFVGIIASASLGRSTGGVFWTTGSAPNISLALFDAALLLGFFLHQAVRRLAPPAENQCPITRFLVLLALVPVPILHFAHLHREEKGQAAFALIALMVVGAVEVGSTAVLMRVHWAKWTAHRGWRSWFTRLALPGWPSAGLYAAAALALSAGLHFALGIRGSETTGQHAWIFALGWEGLVFPAVMISFWRPRKLLHFAAGYFVTQVIFFILALMALNKVATNTFDGLALALDFVCRYLPGSSFWVAADADGKHFLAPAEYAMQLVVLLAVVVLYQYASRPYWAQLKTWRSKQVLATGPQGRSPA